jgi:hypothetical protein
MATLPGETLNHEWLTPRTMGLAASIEALYVDRPNLLFHGWTHARYASQWAVDFGREFPEAEDAVFLERLQAAGLTHLSDPESSFLCHICNCFAAVLVFLTLQES